MLIRQDVLKEKKFRNVIIKYENNFKIADNVVLTKKKIKEDRVKNYKFFGKFIKYIKYLVN